MLHRIISDRAKRKFNTDYQLQRGQKRPVRANLCSFARGSVFAGLFASTQNAHASQDILNALEAVPRKRLGHWLGDDGRHD